MQGVGYTTYLSHAHADHTSGLEYLFASFVAWQIRTSSHSLSEESIRGFVQIANASVRKTRIHADEATLAVVQPKCHELPFEWCVLQTHESLPNNGRLTHFMMESNTIGYRLDWPGHSMAYITDTVARPTAPYVERLSGVDVLLHDCHGPDALSGLMERIGHGYPIAVAQVAARAQVKRLIMVHSSPFEELDYSADLERARQIFPSIEVGYDGMEIDF